MRNTILTMLLTVVSSNEMAWAVVPTVAPAYWKPWNEVQKYAPDLDWSANDIPMAAWRALPKWMTEENEHYPSFPNAFASVDLDGDGRHEWIARSSEGFSGGPEFAILQKRGNRWRTIGEFQGGFTISKRSNKGYADIESWSRHPETYHHLWRFSGGRYKVVRTEVGPWKDRGLDPPYVPPAYVPPPHVPKK